MSHLDEGTLHALLDGELGSTELMEIEAHLAGCSACSTRLRTAREFLEEADRLVGSVQFGNYASTPTASAAQRPTPKPEPAPQPPERPSREHHPWDDASPVLLIPDNPESSPLIRRWPKFVGWAAMIGLVVSGGYLASNFAKESPASMPTSPDAGSTIATGTDSDVPSNAAPSARRDSNPSVLANDAAPADVGLRQAPAKPAPAKPAPVKSAQAKPAPADAGAQLTERRPLPGLSPPRRLGPRRKTKISPARRIPPMQQKRPPRRPRSRSPSDFRQRGSKPARSRAAGQSRGRGDGRSRPAGRGPAGHPNARCPTTASYARAAFPGLPEDRSRRGQSAAGRPGARDRRPESALHGACPGPCRGGGGHHAPGRASGLPGRPGPHDRPRSTAFASRSGCLAGWGLESR